MRMGRSYIASGKGMDSVMNYQWMDSMIRYYNYGDVHKLREKIDDVLLEYPDATLHSLMNSTSTHDFSRLITILGKPELFNYYSKWGWDLVNSDLDFIRSFKLTPEEYERGRNKLLSYFQAIILSTALFIVSSASCILLLTVSSSVSSSVISILILKKLICLKLMQKKKII